MSDPDAEGFLRPTARMLGEEALIPPGNLVRPPPNQFTHEVVTETPFYFGHASDAAVPNGRFAAGTRVVLLVRDERGRCRVVDGQGLYAEVDGASLGALPR